MSKLLQTGNEGWGFYGTCLINGKNAKKEWNKAMKILVEEQELSQEQARDLLDSKWSRHAANELSCGNSLKWQIEKWRSYFVNSVAILSN